MKKLFRIIVGIILIIAGLITVSGGIERLLHGLPVFMWLSIIAFGVATILGGIGVLRGMKFEDAMTFFP